MDGSAYLRTAFWKKSLSIPCRENAIKLVASASVKIPDSACRAMSILYPSSSTSWIFLSVSDNLAGAPSRARSFSFKFRKNVSIGGSITGSPFASRTTTPLSVRGAGFA